MKKLLSALTLIVALCASVQAQAGTLIGEQIFAELGVHYTNTDPFAAGFVSQVPFGTQTVGAGQEWTGEFGASFDFGANTLTASFNSSHLDLPFNGFKFTLANSFLVITNISVLSDSGNPYGGYWSVVIDPAGHGFGIDLNSAMVNTIVLQIDTATVPETGSTLILAGLAMLGLAKFRRLAVAR